MGIEGGGEFPVRRQCADGVGTDDAAHLCHVLARGTACRRHKGEQGHGVCACVDIEGELCEVKSREEDVHVLDRRHTRPCVADHLRLTRIHTGTRRRVKYDVVDRRALVVLVAQELVVLRRECLVTRLCDAPWLADVARRIHAAQVVSHAGHDALRQDVLRVLSRIHRVEGDPLVGLREHLLLERRALQECLTGGFPLLVRGRREFIERNIGEILDIRRFLQKLLKFLVARPLFFFRHSTSSFNLFREGSVSSMDEPTLR